MSSSAENVREFYRKQGEQREFERVVALLKNLVCACEPNCNSMPELSELIELIKERTN